MSRAWIRALALRRAALTTALAVGFAACEEAPSLGTRTVGPKAATVSADCGASFTMVISETDSLMARYDWPTAVDTVSVCETWTGSDYDHRLRRVGSSDDSIAAPDSIPEVRYGAGILTGYAADGGVGSDPSTPAPTAFALMNADSATIQASYDDPYYAVYSPDPGGGGAGDCLDMSICGLSRTGGATASTLAMAPADTQRFRQHGIGRRGVRALIDGMEEVERSPAGERRFRGRRGGAQITLTVDPATQLLVGEEALLADGSRSRTRHVWRRVAGGYVRDRLESDEDELIDGARYHSTATVRFLDVRIGGHAPADAGRAP